MRDLPARDYKHVPPLAPDALSSHKQRLALPCYPSALAYGVVPKPSMPA